MCVCVFHAFELLHHGPMSASPWAPTSLLQEVVSLEHDVSNTGASQPTGFIDLLLRSLLQVLRVHRVQRKQGLPLRSPSDLECLSWIHWDRCGSMGRARAPHGTTWHHQLIPRYAKLPAANTPNWWQPMVPEWLQPSPFERFHPEPSSTGLGVAPGNPSALQGWCSLERCPFANQCHIPCDSFASSGSLFWPGCSHHADLGVPSTRCGQKNYLQATRFYECGGTSYKMVPISASKWFQVHPILPTNSNRFRLQHHILQQPSHGPG